MRVFTEYNDDVPLAADTTGFTGSQESLGAGLAAAGVYRFIQDDPWEVGAGGSVIQTGYLESDVSDFNYSSIAPKVYGSYQFALGPLPAKAEASLTLRHDWLDFKNFETSVAPLLTLTVFPLPRLATSVYAGVSFDSFNDDGANPSVTSRDATQYRVGATGKYMFPGSQQSVGVGAEYRKNDADGKDFVFDSWRLSADFWTVIAGPVSASIAGGYSNEDYTDFTTQPKRTQDNLSATLTVYVTLSPEMTLDAYYSYMHMDGSSDEFTLDRSIVGVGLTYRF